MFVTIFSQYRLSVEFNLSDKYDDIEFTEGRIILFITQNKRRAPRFQSWPTNNASLFAKNVKHMKCLDCHLEFDFMEKKS